jgi:hypothetical protein
MNTWRYWYVIVAIADRADIRTLADKTVEEWIRAVAGYDEKKEKVVRRDVISCMK